MVQGGADEGREEGSFKFRLIIKNNFGLCLHSSELEKMLFFIYYIKRKKKSLNIIQDLTGSEV